MGWMLTFSGGFHGCIIHNWASQAERYQVVYNLVSTYGSFLLSLLAKTTQVLKVEKRWRPSVEK